MSNEPSERELTDQDHALLHQLVPQNEVTGTVVSSAEHWFEPALDLSRVHPDKGICPACKHRGVVPKAPPEAPRWGQPPRPDMGKITLACHVCGWKKKTFKNLLEAVTWLNAENGGVQ